VGAALLLVGCDAFDPEVVVVNDIDEAILVRQVSFNGCLWPSLVAHGEATPPGRCLPGADRVHFQRFDAEQYCRNQVADGDLPELCFCDEQAQPPDDPLELDIIDRTPQWFNYRTDYEVEVERGDVVRIVLEADALEQDFSVAGPYGH
jgi:hypothetical protein